MNRYLLALFVAVMGCQLLIEADPSALVEDNQARCSDQIDNDGDGLSDCDDNSCLLFCIECGNGIVEPGETCDDGANVAGDGCSVECGLEAAASFAADQPINGEQPNLATFAVFSQVLLDLTSPADGTPDALGILVVAGENDDICQTITDAGGFNGFLDALTIQRSIAGEFVVLLARIPGQNELLEGPAALNGEGNADDQTRVDAGFLVNTGGVVVTDTILGSDGTGNLIITALDAGKLSAIYGGELASQFALDPQNPTPIIPPVGFLGEFTAAACSGL
jgi:cysteine-rich repeat protein